MHARFAGLQLHMHLTSGRLYNIRNASAGQSGLARKLLTKGRVKDGTASTDANSIGGRGI